MKILQMLDIPWDSGLAHYALTLAQGLKKRGHQVFVSTRPGEKPWHKAHKLGLKTIPMVSFKGFGALRGFIREHEIDVINAHTGSTHSLAVAAAYGQRAVVIRTRSDARAVKAKVGNGFLFKHTAAVIAAADYIREAYLKTIHLPAQKVITVYQGIETDVFKPAPFPEEPVLGIVARLDPVKGHRYLIEALHLLKSTYPTLRMKIIGQEENIKLRDLKMIAERLRIENQIEFMGHQADVPKVMASCSIGVISSTGSEAVSRAALEWMAMGRPVVATRVGCLPELVEHEKTGLLVPPKDAPALAIAIANLLHTPSRIATLGKAACSRVEHQFGLKPFIDDTLSVYERVLK